MENIIEQVKEVFPWEDRHLRDIDVIRHIVIHRNSMATSGLALAEYFHDTGFKYTKSHLMSYHFFIRKCGLVEQCLPIEVISPGAYGMNKSGIQIAVEGDFRKKKPTKEQYTALVNLCALLRKAFPKATLNPHDIRKPCPGKHLNVAILNTDVTEYMESTARDTLRVKGFTL